MASAQAPRVYPGLGLSIEYDNTESPGGRGRDVYYPIGARGEGSGAGVTHDILSVREVAMMLVTDRLSDKPDWHKKIFDNNITAKWRAEALAWPDDDLWSRATRGKSVYRQEDADETREERDIENILNDECFDFVNHQPNSTFKMTQLTLLVTTGPGRAS